MAAKDDAKTPAKKGAGATKILLILIGALIVVGGSVGATLFLTGALHKNAEAENSAAADPHAAAQTPGHAAPPRSVARQPPIYQPLDPPFIVNFEDQGAIRYLQIGMAAMSRDKLVIDAVNNNMPQIRNNLLLLFGDQKLETLQTNDGKEKLRSQALEQIQAVLNKEIGYPGIEAVYFTAFVMQ